MNEAVSIIWPWTGFIAFAIVWGAIWFFAGRTYGYKKARKKRTTKK